MRNDTVRHYSSVAGVKLILNRLQKLFFPRSLLFNIYLLHSLIGQSETMSTEILHNSFVPWSFQSNYRTARRTLSLIFPLYSYTEICPGGTENVEIVLEIRTKRWHRIKNESRGLGRESVHRDNCRGQEKINVTISIHAFCTWLSSEPGI